MHCFLEKRKLNYSLWRLLKCTNVWHVEDSACFLLRATGWEVLLWLLKSMELSSSCWKGSDFFFFLIIHGKILHFWKRTDQQGGKQNILLVISPSSLEQGQQTWRVPLCLVSGTKPSSRGRQGTVVIDSWYHSYCCPMSWGSQMGITYRQCLSESSQSLLQGTRHTTSSSPPCNQKNCVTTSALYLPALDLNPEVKDFLLSSCYIPEPCHGAQSRALDFHF